MTAELTEYPGRLGAAALEDHHVARAGPNHRQGTDDGRLDYLQAMADGRLPQPPIGGLMEFGDRRGRQRSGRIHLPARRIRLQPDRCDSRRADLHAAGLGDWLRRPQHPARGQGLHHDRDQGELPQGGPSDQRRADRHRHGGEVRIPRRILRRRRDRRVGRDCRHGDQHASRLRPVRATRYVRRMPKRILVIGAGIAGLATANALQQHGHDVTVLEERTDTSSGAGISIWPNALAALDEIGLGDAVRAAGGRITAGAMRWRDGTWLRHPSPQRLVKALGEPLVVIHRNELTSVLAGALAEGTLRYGVSARSLVATADGVQVSLSDATTTEADAVIGADGTHSMVARHLNGPLENRYVGYTAWRGVADCSIDSDFAGEVLGPSVEFGHVPLGGHNTYWFATERAPEGRSAPQGELTYLKDKFGTWAEPIPTVLAATDPAARVAQRPLRPRSRAAMVPRAHRRGGRRGSPDAAASGAGRLSGDRGRSHPGALRRQGRRPCYGIRPVRGVSRPAGAIAGARVEDDRSDREPSPPFLSSAATRAAVLGPEALITRHLATVAARSAFALPTRADV